MRFPIVTPRVVIRAARHMIAAGLFFTLTACGIAPPPANGWAIVAADPTSGDVGVAAASCSELPYDLRAALVPKLGVGAQLGVASPLLRDRFRAWIQNPWSARTIVHNLTTPESDPHAARRQYAMVTLHEGKAEVASFTGSETAVRAGSLEDANAGVVVAGSGVISENVLRVSLEAFRAPENANLALADRLMRGLEAGSAAGGIAECNQDEVAQTASSAFLMQARGSDPEFDVKTPGNRADQESTPPWLALSVTEPLGGRNALVTLRSRYNEWRKANLPECADCLEPRATVPRGGTLTVAPDATLTNNALELVATFVVIVMTGTVVYLVMRPRVGRSVHSHPGE